MRVLITGLLIFITTFMYAQVLKNTMIWNHEGNKIVLHASLPPSVQEVQIRSERNNRMTKITDISSEHPEPQSALPNPLSNKQIWYSVVDIIRNPGRKGHIKLDSIAGIISWNQHLYLSLFLFSHHGRT